MKKMYMKNKNKLRYKNGEFNVFARNLRSQDQEKYHSHVFLKRRRTNVMSYSTTPKQIDFFH